MIISVSQYGNLIKGILDSEPILCRLSVKGEVAECKRSGDAIWFTIKDEFCRMSCFSFTYKDILQTGETVVVTGSPSYYVKSGNLSFYAQEVKPENKRGDMLARLLELKNKLEKEGVFSNNRQVDRYAKKIGVVTSTTGAAVRDIIDVAKRRNPMVSIAVFPSKVQGEGSADSVRMGVEYFSHSDVDTVIVARGGGSKEDLTAFNDEKLVRSVYECSKPVISAVGHEIDFTLCDFAADLRAPTPSAAAELATADIAEVKESLVYLTQRAGTLAGSMLAEVSEDIRYELKYAGEIFKGKLSGAEANLRTLGHRAFSAVNVKQDGVEKRLDGLMSLAEATSPMKLLRRGMAALSVNGRDLNENELSVGLEFDARMHEKRFTARVIGITEEKNGTEKEERS